jgi:hypothetical protein
VPKNITLILLPSRAPELNPVENVWQYLRANWLSNRVFETYEDIIDAACPGLAKPHRPTASHHLNRNARLGPRRSKIRAIGITSKFPTCVTGNYRSRTKKNLERTGRRIRSATLRACDSSISQAVQAAEHAGQMGPARVPPEADDHSTILAGSAVLRNSRLPTIGSANGRHGGQGRGPEKAFVAELTRNGVWIWNLAGKRLDHQAAEGRVGAERQ